MNKRLISLLLVFSIVLSGFSVFATENTNHNAIESNSKVTENIQVEEQVDDKQLDENTEFDINSDFSLKEETAINFNSNSSEIRNVEELTKQEITYKDVVALETNLGESIEESNDIKIVDDTISTVTDINKNSAMGTKFNMDQYKLQDTEIENARSNIGEENPAEKPAIDSTSAEYLDIEPNIEADADTESETEVNKDIINTEEIVIDDSVSEDLLLEEDTLESSTEDNTLISEEKEYDQSLIEYLNNNENFNAVDTSIEAENLSAPEYQISTYATTDDEKMTVDLVNNPYFGEVVNGAAVSLSTGALSYSKNLISIPGRNEFGVDLSIKYNSDTAVVDQDTYTSLAYESVKSFNDFAVGWSFDMTHLTKTRGRYGYYYSDPVLTLKDGSAYEIEYTSYSPVMDSDEVTLKNYELNDIKVTVTFDHNVKAADQIVVKYPDGITEYIDEKTGDLVKSVDRFGNTITYEYTYLNYYRGSFEGISTGLFVGYAPIGYSFDLHALSKIIDSSGKEINIDYAVTETNLGTEIDNIKISVGNTIYATLDLETIEESDNICVLRSITDGENLTTSFEYTKNLTHTFFCQIDDYSVNGTNILLTRVNYPTGGYTDYEYKNTRRSLSTSYNSSNIDWYEVYKISNVTDSDGNNTMYEYHADISGYPYTHPDYETGESTKEYWTIVHEKEDDFSIETTIYTFCQGNLLREDVYDRGSPNEYVDLPGDYDGSVIINNEIYRIFVIDNSIIIYKNTVRNEVQIVSICNLGLTKSTNYLNYLNAKTVGNNIVVFLEDLSGSTDVTYVKMYDTVEKTWTDAESAIDTPREFYSIDGYIYYYKYNAYSKKLTFNIMHPLNKTWQTGEATVTGVSTSADAIHLCNNGTDSIYFLINNELFEYHLGSLNSITSLGTTINKTFAKAFYKDNSIYLLCTDGIYTYEFNNVGLTLVSEFPTEVKYDNTSFMDVYGNINIVSNTLPNGMNVMYQFYSDGFYTSCYRLFDTYSTGGGIVIGNRVIYIGCEKISPSGIPFYRKRTDYTYNQYDQMTSEKNYVFYDIDCYLRQSELWTYVEGYSALSSHTDALGNVTTYAYDDNITNLKYLYPSTVTEYSNTDSPVVTTNKRTEDNTRIAYVCVNYGDYIDKVTYTYDDSYPGNVLKIQTSVLPVGTNLDDSGTLTSEVSYSYGNNTNNNNAYPTAITNYNTDTNTADFTGISNQNQKVYYEYTPLGQVSEEYIEILNNDAKGTTTRLSTSYTYNKNGILTKQINPDNSFVEYTYTFGDENKVVTTYNNEISTVEYYDELGRLIHTGESIDGVNLINTVTYGYKYGNVSYSYNSDGLYTFYYYDPYGRLEKTINTDNPLDREHNILLKQSSSYDDGMNCIWYQIGDAEYYDYFDNYGRLEFSNKDGVFSYYYYDNKNNIIQTDIGGNETTYTYNNRNQLVKVTDGFGNSVLYEYDNRGNTTKVISGVNEEDGITGTSVTYTYDSLNRLMSETNQLGDTEYYAYDVRNNLVALKDRNGVVTTYTYDKMNRLLDTRASETEFISYTYDNFGNVLTMTDLTGETKYEYNEYKLLSEIQNPDESKISYSYDNSKKLTGVLDYDGECITYTYDLLGNVSTISNDVTVMAEYAYNNENQLASLTYPDKGDTTYEYDRYMRIKSLTNKLDDNTIINKYDYEYNSAGNQIKKTETTGTQTKTTTYTYDELNRLSSYTAPDGTKTSYTFDTRNNILNENILCLEKYTYDYISSNGEYNQTVKNVESNVTNYTYNDANQLLTETETVTGDTQVIKTTSYSYDNNGNMVGKTVILDSVVIEDYVYDFDAFNRLKNIDTTYYYSDGTADVYEYYYTYNGNNELSTVSTYKNDDLISVKKYYWDRGYIIKDVTTTAEGGNTKKTITKRNNVEPIKAASFTEEQPVVEAYSLPVNGITCTETINGNNVQIAGQIPDAKTKNQVALVVSTDVNNVNENNIVYIDQTTSTTSGNFNFNFTLPQNPADVNYGYIIGTDADVDSYIGTISEGQTDDEEPTTPARTVTCTETVDGNNVKISGQISDPDGTNQVALIVSTDVNNVNENNIVYIDQTTSTTSGTFEFNFTLPQSSSITSYGYIIGTDADTETYIGSISTIQPEEITRTVTCTETVDGNNVKISGQISDANSKNQVALVVSTDVNNVNENNIVYIDQTTSSTSGTFEFNFTLPQSSSITSYGYIIGTDANTETYIGVINIQQGGNEDDDDDNDHGGDTDITGTTVTVKYYLGADGVFAQTDANGTNYLLKNGHGDTVTIVRNGNVVDDAEYDAYGNVKNPQNITAYTYANYYYDSHSGMYYLRNRFYDPSIARFISEDPVKDGLNWYAYCSGNPIAFVDPLGLLVEILYHTGNSMRNFYGHLDISVDDVVYSFAPYGENNGLLNMYGEGVIMVVDKDEYIENRNADGRDVIAYQLNYTEEQEENLKKILQGYVKNASTLDKKSEIGAIYYYGKKSDGLNKYNVFGSGSGGLNCVDFVAKSLNENIADLKGNDKKSPEIIYTFTNTPSSVRKALEKLFKTPNSLVSVKTTYSKEE